MLAVCLIAGGGGSKARELNDTGLLEHWRDTRANAVNQALARYGHDRHIDNCSHAQRSMPPEAKPTRSAGPPLWEL
jgi:hypothetical protein